MASVVETDRLVVVKRWCGWINYFLRVHGDFAKDLPHRWLWYASLSIGVGGGDPVTPIPTLL